MLQIQNLYYAIGELEILQDVSWAIKPRKRAALIGPNGAGKTTLFRILCGELKQQKGRIVKPKGYRIGYLPQEEIVLEEGTALETVIEGRGEIKVLEKRIYKLHKALESYSDSQDRVLEELGELEYRYDALEGYNIEAEAKSFLSGLGFSENSSYRPLSELSGGWRMRAYLARLLVQKPDLLLLDEPTNHLDLPSIEWLEQYLLGFKGSIIIVSHDRFFIDRLSQEIYELERGVLEYYPGDYHFYLRKKEQNLFLHRKKWEEQQVEIKRQRHFIERFRYKATKAAQVQSRVKQLEKMKKIEPPVEKKRFGFSLKVAERSYKDVLQIKNMSFRYEKDWILQDIDIHLSRGENAALVGVNGAGKTTLTRLITGQIVPRQGEVHLGKKTKVGYYAQHQVDALDMAATVYDEVASTVADNYIPKIRDALGIFRFSGDDVYKKIEVLSGGEKARVSLAKILLSPVNFLIMDEPTNHLDVDSREALEQALSDYDGTLLIISHDRYFLDKLVTRVIEIDEKHIEEYAGNYSYYLEKKKSALDNLSAKNEKKSIEPRVKKTKEKKRQEAQARQAVSVKRNQIEKDIKRIENEIDKIESRKSEVESVMCQPETHKEGKLMVSLQKELTDINKKLQEYFSQWEKDRLELEQLLTRLFIKNVDRSDN